MNINKNKNLLLIIIVVAAIFLVAAGLLFFYYRNFGAPVLSPQGIILFYGEGCSHCETVDEYITLNKVEEKVKFDRLEVFKNEANQKILLEKTQACNIKTDQVGVPLLWDGKSCIIGDEDIIKFFEEKIK